METRSKTQAKVGRSPGSSVGDLENPVPRPLTEVNDPEEDLGLTALMGDGEALDVGRGRAMGSATTSGTCDAPVVTEQFPAREPVSEISQLPPSTLSLETSTSSLDLAQSDTATVVDAVKPYSTTQVVTAKASIPTLGSNSIPTL